MSVATFVFFDAVGTLIRPEPSPGDVYAAVGARHGLTLPRAEVAARFRAAFKRQEALDRATGDWVTSPEREYERWRLIVSEVFAELPGSGPAFAELWEHFARPEAWRPYDDAARAIRVLDATGRPWGIASNFDARLHRVAAGLPELKNARAIVTSAEVGFRKPGRGFFRAAEAAVGRDAGELWLVGDDEENDRLGATAAGWRCVLLDRGQGDEIDVARLA